MLVGGLLGTLPDLDVLVQYTDAVASFTYHRSWSHSLITLTLISPVIAWLLHRYFPRRWVISTARLNLNEPSSIAPGFSLWCLTVWLILITHPILDGFTIYGTQLYWPIPTEPVAIGSIFIIDPAYTLPLIVGMIVAWRGRQQARRAVLIGLFVSSIYLGFTLISQHHARRVAIDSLSQQGLATTNVLVAPAPFAVFWRIVSMDKDYYHEGFYSLFDERQEMEFDQYSTNRDLIESNQDHWPITRLDWFTSGMISAEQSAGSLVINDLRMGIESSYVFRFSVGDMSDRQLAPATSTLLPMKFDQVRMRKLMQRVLNEHVDISP